MNSEVRGDIKNYKGWCMKGTGTSSREKTMEGRGKKLNTSDMRGGGGIK